MRTIEFVLTDRRDLCEQARATHTAMKGWIPAGGFALDQARIARVGSGFGKPVEVLRATYQSQTFARHSHDTYTLGLVLGGAGSFWCRGAERFTSKGDVVVIPPGEVHTGSVSSGVESLSYLAIYLPVELAVLHAEAAGRSDGKPPEFGALVLRDPVVLRAYEALDRAIGAADAFRHRHVGANAAAASGRHEAAAHEDAAQEAACVAITELIGRHASRRTQSSFDRSFAIEREPRIVGVVREVLEDSYARGDETSLQVLAQRTGVTPFHIIRAFRDATGLAPHQYLIQVRVERARQFLADGAVPSMVAAMTGFVDQSHLTYHFKKHLGITPGNYRRCVAN